MVGGSVSRQTSAMHGIARKLLHVALAISISLNALLIGFAVLRLTVFYYQTPENFIKLTSARRFSEIADELKNVRIFKCSRVSDSGLSDTDAAFVVPKDAQHYPVSNELYCCYSIFPPGRFCVHVGDDGFVEHIRFYSDDGHLGEDGVRR